MIGAGLSRAVGKIDPERQISLVTTL